MEVQMTFHHVIKRHLSFKLRRNHELIYFCSLCSILMLSVQGKVYLYDALWLSFGWMLKEIFENRWNGNIANH